MKNILDKLDNFKLNQLNISTYLANKIEHKLKPIELFLFDEFYIRLSFLASKSTYLKIKHEINYFICTDKRLNMFIEFLNKLLNTLFEIEKFDLMKYYETFDFYYLSTTFSDKRNVTDDKINLLNYLINNNIIIKINNTFYRINTNYVYKGEGNYIYSIDEYLNLLYIDLGSFDYVKSNQFINYLKNILNKDDKKANSKQPKGLSICNELLDLFAKRNKLIYEDYYLKKIKKFSDFSKTDYSFFSSLTSLKYIKLVYKRFLNTSIFKINEFEKKFLKNLKNKKINSLKDENKHIANINDFVNNDLTIKVQYFKDWLLGQTLDQIAIKNSLTKERIRQVIESLITKIKTKYNLVEFSYLDIFSKYQISENSFNYISKNLGSLSYNFLLKLTKKKNKNKLPEIELLKLDWVDENLKEIILKKNNLILVNDNIIDNKISKIITHIYKIENKRIKINDFIKIYNEKYSHLTKREISRDRKLEGMFDNNDLLINGPNFSFRYYDIKQNISLLNKQKLISIISEYEDGLYSTLKFFNDNIELMEELDIRDEYELHNILRKLKIHENVNITYGRMPNILKGSMSKQDFYENIINDYSPITSKELINFICLKYGYKKSSFLANDYKEYISKYVHNGIVNSIEFNVNNEDDIYLINNFLNNREVVLTNEVYDFAEKNNIDKTIFHNKYFSKIGYHYHAKNIIRNDISIKKLIIDKMVQNKIYKNEYCEYIHNCQLQQVFKNELLKNDIIQLSTKELMLYEDFYNTTNINKEMINDFIIDCNNFINNDDFVSIANIINNVSCEITDGRLSDITISKLLSNTSKFSVVTYGEKYYIKQKNNEITFPEYIENLVKNNEIKLLDDLIEMLEEKFNHNFNEENILKIVSQFKDIYFDEGTRLFFESRDDYLDEIFKHY